MVSVRRQTAIKCRIADLLNGRYVKREGWEPNYFDTNIGKVSRINILATVIGSEGNVTLVDDGTGQIELRTFEEESSKQARKVGDVVLVIGRPRVFNDNKYIVPEIVKSLNDPKWIAYRNLELGTPVIEKKSEVVTVIKAETKPKVDIQDSILQKISELDNGYGVKIDDLLKSFEEESANLTINKLIEQGEIFEIKPGIVKSI